MPEPLLEAHDVRVVYPGQRSHDRPVRAVDGVDLVLAKGDALGLVGESGCGKSSLARALIGLEAMTGSLSLSGEALGPCRTHEQARRVQMVFQDPHASLNPRLSVRHALEEILRVHKLRPRAEIPGRARELVELVGLPPRALDARPAALSGGQRQRVAIARALALEPDVLLADEPTTALDVSVQAVILELIVGLRERLGLTLLLITHNLAVVAAVCDRTAVMYLGRVIEEAPTADLLDNPRHPYTARLLDAVPRLRGTRRAHGPVPSGDPPDPAHVPEGCPYHPRCPIRTPLCTTDRPLLSYDRGPLLLAHGPRHHAACHYTWAPEVAALSENRLASDMPVTWASGRSYGRGPAGGGQ